MTRIYPYESIKNIACSGAVMHDITAGPRDYIGQRDRLAGKTGISAESALASFQPGWIPQATFVQRYEPGMVTIGIGGNDAGLIGKLKACVMPDMCEWVTSEGRSRTATEIRALFDRLVGTYERIKSVSPSSKVFIVGYPNIIQPDGTCDPLLTVLLAPEERRFMRESIAYLNDIIEAAAASAGVHYLDIEESLTGHTLCSQDPIAINHIRVYDPATIASYLPVLRIVGTESFHPTPEGHRLIARAIETEMNKEKQSSCSPRCTQQPPPSDYWGISSESDPVRQIAYTFLSAEHFVPQEVATLSLPRDTFRSGSSVEAVIRSQPYRLVTLRASLDGSLVGTVTFPAELEEGFHTIHLYGTSASGEAVDLYQVVSYGKVLSENEGTYVNALSDAPFSLQQSSVRGAAAAGMPVLPSQSAVQKDRPGHRYPLCMLVIAGFAAAVLAALVTVRVYRAIRPTKDRGG